MTQEEGEQSLERFWRKNHLGQGTGLGLTIVQRIIATANGQLLVEPASERGLCVVMKLPLKVLP